MSKNIRILISPLIVVGFLLFLGLLSISAEEKKSVEEVVTTEKVTVLTKEAEEFCKSGKYKSAKEKMTEALKLAPDKKEIADKIFLLNEVLKIGQKEAAKTRESELIRKGLVYYWSGDIQSGLDIFAYALSLHPQDEKLKNFYNELKNKYHPLGDSGNMNPVIDPTKETLLRSLDLFYKGKYAETIALCNEVLKLDSYNVTALERKGSAFYKLGQKKEAKEAWEKAYRFDPENASLKKFIDKLNKELGTETKDAPSQASPK